MIWLCSKLLLILLVSFPSNFVQKDGQGIVMAAEDKTEDEVETEIDDQEARATTDEESDAKVETEGEEPAAETTAAEKGEGATEEEEEKAGLRISPDAETSVLFPKYPDKQLPAGRPINVLIGLHNKGTKDFIVETIDASFRYPQDYSYHIQNFTGYRYGVVVQPNNEASFEYLFHPHESYGGRPFGLTIIMTYKDSEGTQYGAGVFNETITFQEVEESFDTETFFLYVLLAAVGLLIVFGLNYAFNSFKGKKGSTKAPVVEMGTQQKTDVDYDWLPKETTTGFSKPSPRRSPRNRRVKRSSGSAEE